MNPADIAERLRKWRMWPETSEVAGEDIYILTQEAAAEIEQLREELDVNRTALDMKHAEIERLRGVAKHLGKLASAHRDALEAKLSKAVEALEQISENGTHLGTRYRMASIARATLKELGGGGD